MKKTYSIPEVDSTPVCAKDWMLTQIISTGGEYDQNGFYTPSRPNEYNPNH